MSTISRATGTADAGKNVPMDWDWVDENDGGPTFMSLWASSYHPGGVNALFADGSVHFVKNTVNPVTWYGLGTIAGGEVISSDHIDLSLNHRRLSRDREARTAFRPPAVSFLSDGEISQPYSRN